MVDQYKQQAPCITKLHTTIMVPFRVANCEPGKEVNLKAVAKCVDGAMCEKNNHPLWKSVPPGERVKNDVAAIQVLQDYQARMYFHPFVQHLWMDTGVHRLYRREDIKSLEYTAENGKQVRLNVLSCELALFDPDIGILILNLAFQANSPALELNEVQQLHDAIRRLYPPYFDFSKTEKDGAIEVEVAQSTHCARQIDLYDSNENSLVAGHFDNRDKIATAQLASHTNESDGIVLPLAAHWRFLIQPFSAEPEKGRDYWAVQLGDDRAPMLSHLAFPDPMSLSDGDMVRLCFADESGASDTLPNAQSFLRDFDQRYCYDRWWEPKNPTGWMSTRTMNCGYVFMMIGKENTHFTNEDNGILFNFRHIYMRLGLLAHVQKAALLAASWRLSQFSRIDANTGEPAEIDAEKVRRFYRHFLKFTHRLWFDEVSPQEQGRELFDMWRKELRIQELYDEVRQELQDLLEYVDTCEARAQTEQASRLTRIATTLGTFGLAFSFLGMNFFEGKDGQFSFFGWTWKTSPLYIFGYSISLIAVTCLITYFFVLWSIKRPGKNNSFKGKI